MAASQEQEQDESSKAAIRAEQIRTLYRQSLAIAFVSPVNAAIVAGVLWPSDHPVLLIAWVAAMIGVTIFRAVLRNRYLGLAPPAEEAPIWARRYVAGAVAAGVLWGLAGALFYDSRALVPQLLLIFVSGGMVAGASATLALHLPAFLGFAVPAVLLTATRILLEGDTLHLAMGALAIIYGIAMTIVAANTHSAITETLRLRFEKQHLLERLSRTQISLADANRTLELRVAERGAALERQAEFLRDAQRMESVGLLAGGIAHDFNNLLTVILGNIAVLFDDPGLTAENRTALDQIRRSASRGATLVSQLLAFSRRQVMVKRILDLNGVVSEVQPLLGRLIGEHIEPVVMLYPDPLPVKADPTQLEQVIINLATNARDAMTGGGRLTIQTELVEASLASLSIPSGSYALLSVRDTGVGMDAEAKRMAFDPFFTTKEVGRGTGLGLATVYGIVEQSDGHVFVESEPGRGSCFRVFLPRVSAENIELPAPQKAPAAESAIPPATILLAEDEAMVRALIARILRSAGFTIIEAENGEQALTVSRQHSGHIDLLISDMVMAKMGGLELAKRIASERPGLRTLLVSGYSNEELSEDDEPNIIGFLQKPFNPKELIGKVHQFLLSRPVSDTPAGRPKPAQRAASTSNPDA